MNDDGIPIYLTKGYVAYVDADDVHLVGYLWCAQEAPNGRVYAVRRMENGKMTSLHRAVMNETNRLVDIDHLDGNGLNCRKKNMARKSRGGNNANVGAPRKDNESGYVGVSWDKRKAKWYAYINYEGKRLRLGMFAKPAEANRARLIKEREVHGVLPRRRDAFMKAGLL